MARNEAEVAKCTKLKREPQAVCCPPPDGDEVSVGTRQRECSDQVIARDFLGKAGQPSQLSLCENRCRLFGTTNVQMVSDYPFKPHPPGLRSVKDTGVGDLELAEGQLVGVTGLEVLGAEGRRQTPPPTPEEAAHGPRTQPITDALQRFGIGARAESVVQGRAS